MLLGHLFKLLNRVDHYLFGTGGWRLLAHESKIMNAVIDNLPNDAKLAGKAQLEQRFFIERSNSRISFIPRGELPDTLKIADEDFINALYKVRMTVDGKKETANVTFLDGLVFSVEMRRPRKLYTGKDIQITAVEKGNPKQSMTFAIDRHEHGRMPE